MTNGKDNFPKKINNECDPRKGEGGKKLPTRSEKRKRIKCHEQWGWLSN